MPAKPYFLTPIHNQHADIGSPLTWRCDARASPTPTFQWMRNGKPVVSDPKRFIRVNNNVLTISKLDPDLHNGMYQCSASNIHGTSLSEGQLRVLALAPNFYKFPMQPSTRAPLFGNVTLPCKPEGAPASKITWYRNGIELNVVDSGTYSVTPGGRLRMTSVQSGDSGRYTCKAENFLGVAENTTELYIVEGTHITEGPEDTKAVVNTTVFLECSASHAPEADMIFQWRFNGMTIDFRLNPEYDAVHAGPGGVSGLYIKQVNHHHTGWFECVAITTINSDIKGAYLQVLGSYCC
ncbi:contactin [Elysia marginata]|uniref:Contactin n=1 Tax=Elysia marginata TaxID=1093978 RepID=A0AAV4IN50_9GAST|nr:contactin [Elysia marginata]